jgi:PEP-CTERM motif
MKKFTLRNAVLLLALCCLAAGAASASVVTTFIAFPTAGDTYCTTAYGCGTIPGGGSTDFMFTAGDYVQSASFTLHNGPIVGLSADWTYQNFMGGGSTETWWVYINATPVALFIAPDDAYNGDVFSVIGSVSFAPYTVPLASSYTVSLVLQNTVPFGGGSIAINDGGITGITTVPEPGTLVLLGSSLLGFAGIARRKLIG